MFLQVSAYVLWMLFRLISSNCILTINEVSTRYDSRGEATLDFLELKAVGCKYNERPDLKSYSVIAFSASHGDHANLCHLQIELSRNLASAEFENDTEYVLIDGPKADNDSTTGPRSKQFVVALLKSKRIRFDYQLREITQAITNGNIDPEFGGSIFDLIMYEYESYSTPGRFEHFFECYDILDTLRMQYRIYLVRRNMSINSCPAEENAYPLDAQRFAEGNLTRGTENSCIRYVPDMNDWKEDAMDETDPQKMNVFVKIPGTPIEHFFHTRPFVIDWGSPRIPVVIDDMKLLILLPYHVLGGFLDLTVFDFWTDRVYTKQTEFPLSNSQIDQGIFYTNHLYIFGRGTGSNTNKHFICRYNFEDNQWSVLWHTGYNTSRPVTAYLRKENGFQWILNFINRFTLIMDVTDKSDFRITVTKSVNDPPPNVLRTIASGDRIFALSYDDNRITAISELHLPSMTWEMNLFQMHHSFYPNGSLGYWSFFVRNSMLTMFVPYQDGTRVWQLDLANIKDGWLEREPLSEIIVWTTYTSKTDELYGVRVVDGPDDGYMLSSMYWRFENPSPAEKNLETLVQRYTTEAAEESKSFKSSVLDVFKTLKVMKKNKLLLHRFELLDNMSLTTDVYVYDSPL